MTRLSELARRLWADELGRTGAVLHAALLPGEVAYGLAVRVRDQAYTHGVLHAGRATVPVISVGNIAVGGTGKTPFTHWLAVRLRERDRRPAVLHGGYGSDEPELHRAWAPDIPVIVQRDRIAGAVEAVDRGCDTIVLDDAFQHRRLHRDLDIVLVAAERWFRPRRLLPRGPWREPAAALQRADLIVVTRKTAPAAIAEAAAAELAAAAGRPTLVAHLRPTEWRLAADAGTAPASAATVPADAGHQQAAPRAAAPAGPVLLVCGIAEPELFAENVQGLGARVAERLCFPDHHAYDAADAERILAAAGERPIVTTEKDWTKLRHLLPADRTWLLAQELRIEQGLQLLDDHLDRVLA